MSVLLGLWGVFLLVAGFTVAGVSLSDFAKAAPQNGTCTVTSIMTPVARLAHVDADTNALDAMKQLSSSGFHQLLKPTLEIDRT